MPPRRRHLARAQRGWSQEDCEFLLSGIDVFGDGTFTVGRDEIDLELARQAWGELRDRLLPEFIGEHPGRRCWAFWAFESSEPRRIVAGKENPESGYPPWRPGCKRQ